MSLDWTLHNIKFISSRLTFVVGASVGRGIVGLPVGEDVGFFEGEDVG